jgi:hypothetical protein
MLQCRKRLDFLHCSMHLSVIRSKDRGSAVNTEKTDGQDP